MVGSSWRPRVDGVGGGWGATVGSGGCGGWDGSVDGDGAEGGRGKAGGWALEGEGGELEGGSGVGVPLGGEVGEAGGEFGAAGEGSGGGEIGGCGSWRCGASRAWWGWIGPGVPMWAVAVERSRTSGMVAMRAMGWVLRWVARCTGGRRRSGRCWRRWPGTGCRRWGGAQGRSPRGARSRGGDG